MPFASRLLRRALVPYQSIQHHTTPAFLDWWLAQNYVLPLVRKNTNSKFSVRLNDDSTGIFSGRGEDMENLQVYRSIFTDAGQSVCYHSLWYTNTRTSHGLAASFLPFHCSSRGYVTYAMAELSDGDVSVHVLRSNDPDKINFDLTNHFSSLVLVPTVALLLSCAPARLLELKLEKV